ncbi:hypothetical protein B0H11DRAFT_2254237 [Mycena galericulata]|nr:hypothetical protein B0H11DRAFT_2254237 [Mycena galericulata]
MLNKFFSSAILLLALAHAAIAGPGPVKLQCGAPYDPPCPSGDLCCGSLTGIGNFCQNGQLDCHPLNPTK